MGLLALAFVGVGDIITVGIDWTQTCFTNAPLGNVTPAAHLYVGAPGSLAPFIDQPQQGVARQECWEEWAFHRDAPLWTGDVPQARAQDASQATVSNVRRTQGSFTFDVDAKVPALVELDSAFDHGWRSSVGEVTAMNEDLLAVEVPAGAHHVVVKYWPHGLTLGLWLSGLAAGGIVAFFVWDRRRRNARALA
jgi:hypothetical protein